jgi:hypothetical protein
MLTYNVDRFFTSTSDVLEYDNDNDVICIAAYRLKAIAGVFLHIKPTASKKLPRVRMLTQGYWSILNREFRRDLLTLHHIGVAWDPIFTQHPDDSITAIMSCPDTVSRERIVEIIERILEPYGRVPHIRLDTDTTSCDTSDSYGEHSS